MVVLAYYIGQLANVLSLPGGIDGIESGMIGSFIALGVSGSIAALAVLAYRLVSFWLPILPSSIAYLRLAQRSLNGMKRTATNTPVGHSTVAAASSSPGCERRTGTHVTSQPDSRAGRDEPPATRVPVEGTGSVVSALLAAQRERSPSDRAAARLRGFDFE